MTLTIGILGAAGIAPQAMINPVRRRTGDAVIAAVASRSEQNARNYATKHAIPRWYSDYRSLLADDTIDLVYVALPPSEHAEWTIAALEAGKHVLCEKPMAMNAAEATLMAAAARRTGRRLFEAFHDSYHPLSAAVQELATDGRIGEVQSMSAEFSVSIPFSPESLRHVPSLGGGALMDLGCYPVHWVRALLGEEPRVESAAATLNQLGADESITANLVFPSGITAVVTATMAPGTVLSSVFEIHGTRGSIRVNNPVFAHKGHTIRHTIGDIEHNYTVGGRETYDHQLDAVIEAVTTSRALPTDAPDAVANMQVIDAIYAAAGIAR